MHTLSKNKKDYVFGSKDHGKKVGLLSIHQLNQQMNQN